MSQEQPIKKSIITEEDAMKMGIPTSLEDIFSFGEEGKTIADIISMIMGGDKKDELNILQRTNLTKRESSIVADTLVLAKYGLIIDDSDLQNKTGWDMPWLMEDIVLTLRGRTSVDFKSLNLAVEALQSIKLKTEVQKQTMMSQQ